MTTMTTVETVGEPGQRLPGPSSPWYRDRTRAYAQRRAAEGRTKPEVIRCLKRYIARETYHALQADLADLQRPRPPRSVSITCDAGFIGRTRRQTS